MKSIDIILSVVGGAICGAALGLLFAPKKGEDTREEIVKFLESKGIKVKRNKLEELVDEIAAEMKK